MKKTLFSFRDESILLFREMKKYNCKLIHFGETGRLALLQVAKQKCSGHKSHNQILVYITQGNYKNSPRFYRPAVSILNRKLDHEGSNSVQFSSTIKGVYSHFKNLEKALNYRFKAAHMGKNIIPEYVINAFNHICMTHIYSHQKKI